jgi:hypothetical protein
VTVYSRLAFAASATAAMLLLAFTQSVEIGKQSIQLLNSYDFAISTGAKTVLIAFASGSLYGIFSKITSLYLWKHQPFRLLLGIHTPRVYGVWDVWVEKEVEGKTIRNDIGIFEICQTWRTIGITLDSEEVSSRSVSAAIDVTANRVSVEYQFFAERALGAKSVEPTHRGAAVLRLRLDKKYDEPTPQLSYFTEHKEIGNFVLTKKAGRSWRNAA